ncbi:hypothetical protein B0T25DRAFT_458922 [Lasiosphaeria hispida]|uniref:Rhodopsin domain-containing protein n=1 Tax=Lasiosphaeria hispida TaxID=260671 RepID=A0AAJ0HE46_9PEZI|nr:hypothetical protein B0T25DRAFT_458922 [Lasiosphaeria hispida]
MAAATPPNPPPPDENAGPALTIINSLLIAFILITTCLRIVVRFSARALGLDDYMIAVVAVLCVVRVAIQVVQVNQFGNGRHHWYIPEYDYINNNMLGWYSMVLLFVTTCFLKISICLLLLRIKNNRTLKIFIYIIMAGLVITNFGCVVILLAQCKPISVYWTGTGGACWDTRVRIYSIYFTIAYSLLTDFICSLLPLVVVWNVCIPWRTKASVCGLMGLGLVATGFGVARATSLGLVTTDLSWAYCIAAIWSNLELFLGVIAANLALSHSYYAYLFGKGGVARSSRSRRAGYHPRSGYAYQSSLSHGGVEPPSTVITSRGRRPSISKSESSDIPLEPGIHKKTAFTVMEEYPDDSPSEN